MCANCNRCTGLHSTVAPGVEQHRGALPGRHRWRQARTIDPRQHPECRMRGHDAGAGVAGAKQRARVTRGHVIAATRIDALGLRRSALAGDSDISIRRAHR